MDPARHLKINALSDPLTISMWTQIQCPFDANINPSKVEEERTQKWRYYVHYARKLTKLLALSLSSSKLHSKINSPLHTSHSLHYKEQPANAVQENNRSLSK